MEYEGVLEFKNSKGKWNTAYFAYHAATDTLSMFENQADKKANREPATSWKVAKVLDKPAGGGFMGRKQRFDVVQTGSDFVVALNAKDQPAEKTAWIKCNSRAC